MGAPFESSDNNGKIQLTISSREDLQGNTEELVESVQDLTHRLGFKNEDPDSIA